MVDDEAGVLRETAFLRSTTLVGDDYYERTLRVTGKIRKYDLRDYYLLSVVSMRAIMREIVKRVHPKLVCVCYKRMMRLLEGLLAELVRRVWDKWRRRPSLT